MTNAQRPNSKRKLESDAHKAFSYYLAVRRSYQRRQATLEQIAYALALLDSALERLNQAGLLDVAVFAAASLGVMPRLIARKQRKLAG